MSHSDFERLTAEALAQDFSGWDFSWLQGRWYEEDPPWSYEGIVTAKIERAASLLDMGTGGGEFLASLAPLPPFTVATESYAPNIPVAQERLEPLGVRIVPFTEDSALPLQDNQFDLIINRHDSYSPAEIHRLLKPGGRFITQQVGSQDCIQLNEYLNAPPGTYADSWTLENEINAFRQAGFQIERAEEALLDSIFYDIGAIVFYLKIIEWQIPDFSPERYHEQLLAMHRYIEATGAFNAKAHRFLLQVRK